MLLVCRGHDVKEAAYHIEQVGFVADLSHTTHKFQCARERVAKLLAIVRKRYATPGGPPPLKNAPILEIVQKLTQAVQNVQEQDKAKAALPRGGIAEVHAPAVAQGHLPGGSVAASSAAASSAVASSDVVLVVASAAVASAAVASAAAPHHSNLNIAEAKENREIGPPRKPEHDKENRTCRRPRV